MLGSTNLVREAHTRRLISTRAMMAWLVEFLPICNLAQVGFIAQLIGDYLPDMLEHSISARHCIRVACDKVQEVSEGRRLSTNGRSMHLQPKILSSEFETCCGTS